MNTVPTYLQELNNNQREAVEHTEGPCLVLAGAGSGKTRVLTYRIAHIIQQGIDPFNILALTFTNKAAKEMQARIFKIIGSEARNVWMGTFHSIFARILRSEGSKLGYPTNFSIYDTEDSKRLLKTIIKEYALNDSLYKPNVVFYRISSAKNSLITPESYLNNPSFIAEDESSGRPKLGLIYSVYAKRCYLAGAMDFDDLLLKTYELLSRFPEALHKYQHLFKYVLIDEFQDTNYAQYTIIKKLVDVFQNLCVVGDDAQSIYSFRGAIVDNILNFEKDYPELGTYRLEQNYRSTKTIVEAANHIINNNKGQLKKQLWTDNEVGDKIKVIKAISDRDEGRLVADAIAENKLRDHINNQDIAILYRTNVQSRIFEEALRKLNIPYQVYGGLSFYQRKEVKDFLAYLKITINEKDEESLRRIINYPTRGIGKSSLEKATVLASEKGVSLWEILETIHQYDLSPRAVKPIHEFVVMIKSFQSMIASHNAYDLATHIAKSVGLMKTLYDDKSVEGLSRYENFQELLNGIKAFIDNPEFNSPGNMEEKQLGSYLQQIMLLTDADNERGVSDKVKLMTIHAAKGLEFPYAYIVGLEENLFPSMMALNNRLDLEEERRLFYVALTRAMNKAVLSFANSRYRHGNLLYTEPSRFLQEIPAEYLENDYTHRSVKTAVSHTPRQNVEPLRRNVVFSKRTSYVPDKDFIPDDPATIEADMDIEHARFGFGKVVMIEGASNNRIATIDFKEQGEKKIMLQYAKLRIKKNSSDV